MAHYSQYWGGTLTEFEGQIASPLYPNVYPNDISVEWRVDTQFKEEVIRYRVQEFDVVCEDLLTIWDSEKVDASLLFRGCDDYLKQNPGRAGGVTKGSTLLVSFVSDKLLWGKG